MTVAMAAMGKAQGTTFEQFHRISMGFKSHSEPDHESSEDERVDIAHIAEHEISSSHDGSGRWPFMRHWRCAPCGQENFHYAYPARSLAIQEAPDKLMAITHHCEYCRAMRPPPEGTGATLTTAGAAEGATSAVEDRGMVAAGEVNDFAFTAMTIPDTTGVRGSNQERFANEVISSGTQMKLAVLAAFVGAAAGFLIDGGLYFDTALRKARVRSAVFSS